MFVVLLCVLYTHICVCVVCVYVDDLYTYVLLCVLLCVLLFFLIVCIIVIDRKTDRKTERKKERQTDISM